MIEFREEIRNFFKVSVEITTVITGNENCKQNGKKDKAEKMVKMFAALTLECSKLVV